MPVRISNQTERAVVEASVAQFQAATSTNLVSLAPPLPASLPGDGQGGAPGQPMTGSGGKGTNSNASAVPSFAELAPGFRPPTPGSLNGKLPEPVLLQLPSDILFDFDSSRLKPEADPLLQQALTMIQKYPRAKIDVIGHTDTIGDDTYNQQLSEARALSVVTQLKQKLTASAYTLRSRGFGKTRPLVNPNGSAVEQSRNRRVEVIIQALAE
jgi:outer membrane protein OmpA-like peptidoglycan-associated protein